MQLLADIDAVLVGEKYKQYQSLAQEMLAQHSPEEVIAALLRINYEESFNPESYKQIAQVKVDTAGKTRLFIALGRKAGHTPRSIVELLTSEAKVKSKDIDDVRVMDDFSFVTLPYSEAENVLYTFKTQKVQGKSLITKAKAPRGSDSNFSSRGKGRSGRSAGRNERSGARNDKF